MKRLSPIYIAFAAIAGLLLLAIVAVRFWPLLPANESLIAGDGPVVAELAPAAAERAPPDFDLIVARPVFSEDRKPLQPPAPVANSNEPVPTEAPQNPLNVMLTGTVRMGDRRLALVTDNMTGQAYALEEGRPLPGEQGAWVLAAVEGRRVSFDGGALGTTALELNTTQAALQAPSFATPISNITPVVMPAPPAADSAGVATGDARAEEIRRRVEERRRQLREEALRLAKEREAQDANKN